MGHINELREARERVLRQVAEEFCGIAGGIIDRDIMGVTVDTVTPNGAIVEVRFRLMFADEWDSFNVFIRPNDNIDQYTSERRVRAKLREGIERFYGDYREYYNVD